MKRTPYKCNAKDCFGYDENADNNCAVLKVAYQKCSFYRTDVTMQQLEDDCERYKAGHQGNFKELVGEMEE